MAVDDLERIDHEYFVTLFGGGRFQNEAEAINLFFERKGARELRGWIDAGPRPSPAENLATRLSYSRLRTEPAKR